MATARFDWDLRKDAENQRKHGVASATAQDIGARERQSMRAKIKYTDEPLGRVRVVTDFLPPPEQLAVREEGQKVTLALSRKSVEFFKSEAAKHRTQYQRMIRRLLDAYVDAHTSREGRGSARSSTARARGT